MPNLLEEVLELLAQAYEQGCCDTHTSIQAEPELALMPVESAEFGEAARDYAHRALTTYIRQSIEDRSAEPSSDASDSASPAADVVEKTARIIGDNFSPNVTFDKSSAATQAACRRAAWALTGLKVEHTLSMSDEEIMAEPGAREAAEEVGRVLDRALAIHDIGKVRDRLQAAYDDANGAPGYRNFCGHLAEQLSGALARLAAGQPLNGLARDGSGTQKDPVARHVETEESLDEALAETGCRDFADLTDMARVGKSLLESIDALVKHPGPFHGWMPNDDPAEIVFDLVNHYEDAARPQGHTEGWRLVPVEPSETLIEAMATAYETSLCIDPMGSMEDAYRAMLAGAPAPPSSTEEPRS
jgi:hypothetical protein